MKESIRYVRFFQNNLLYLVIGGFMGGIFGVGLIYFGGTKYEAVNTLELTASEGQIQTRTLMTDAAVVWGREVARERGWISPEYRYRIYKAGPLVVKTEVEGADLRVVEISKRFSDELIAKYGFSKLRGLEIRKVNVYPYLYGVILAGVGMLFGLFFCLIKSYRRNY